MIFYPILKIYSHRGKSYIPDLSKMKLCFIVRWEMNCKSRNIKKKNWKKENRSKSANVD